MRLEYGMLTFWRDAIAIRGSVLLRVIRRVLFFGLLALVVHELNALLIHIDLGVGVAPYEVAGAALGLLLVLRTNAGYDRWWEARKLWGGITNQSRNLAIAGLAYGPDDLEWRRRLVRWTSAFAPASRSSLRGERSVLGLEALLGVEDAARVAAAGHMPGYVALRIAEVLRDGLDRDGLDRFAFLQAEQSRALLIDHIGGCERILRTPLPFAYAIEIRRFIVLFLTSLPFALLDKVGVLTPLATILIAYPILSLDDIGAQLQNPFAVENVGHLPLDEICEAIRGNLEALLEVGSSRTHAD